MTSSVASRRARRWIACSAIATITVGVILWLLLPRYSREQYTTGVPKVGSAPGEPVPLESPPATAVLELDVARLALHQRWDDVIAQAGAAVAGGPDETRAFVRRLFAALDELSPSDRLTAARGFLTSGRDVRFGRAFVIGAGGFLQDWPTLRVAMFDYLAQRDGGATRELAEAWLQQRPSEPGEWTLAMRELARGRAAEQWTQPLTQAMHVFMNDPAWSRASDPAWLEGFDVVVAGRSALFLPDLARVAANAPTRAAKFAGFLAADRLMLVEPTEMLAALNATPTLFAEESNVRAGLFARVDVRQPAQLRELESYFLRDDVSGAERADFGGLFPLYDLAVSHNLLTSPPSRALSDMLAHDRAALTQIDAWLADSRFRATHEQLRKIADKLTRQISQASVDARPR